MSFYKADTPVTPTQIRKYNVTIPHIFFMICLRPQSHVNYRIHHSLGGAALMVQFNMFLCPSISSKLTAKSRT